jgi:hemerythrin-like domain-containing protein
VLRRELQTARTLAGRSVAPKLQIGASRRTNYKSLAHYFTHFWCVSVDTLISIIHWRFLHFVSNSATETAMGFTEKFRLQHNEILGVAGEITEELRGKGDAAVMRKLLSNLAGKLNFHLALEDNALYPRLMERKDSKANVMAKKFLHEMGGLGQAFTAYNNKWQVSAIRSDPSGFANETRAVFSALTQRIAKENRELYPLADQES